MTVIETVDGIVPLPPSVNEAYHYSPKTGRKYDSEKKKAWEEAAHKGLRTAIPRRLSLRNTRTASERKRKRDDNHWQLRLVVKLSSYRRDIDNCAKVVIDVLANRLRLDDRYLTHIVIVREAVTEAEEGVAISVRILDRRGTKLPR